MQFRVPDGCNTKHNVEAREKILSELSLKFWDRYTANEYKIAIPRTYENCRLRYGENVDPDLKKKNKNRRRGHTNRWQTMERMERVLVEKEKEPWKNVKSELMSNEEDGDEEVFFKSLPWRAQKLNDLIKVLDMRLASLAYYPRNLVIDID
ncbi:uncharacterized protein LOC144353328 [Saccoglossus kowalevskii]